MNIQNIKNETIAKLTAKEIGELGLLNYGVMTYRGQLKCRVKGYKTVKVSDLEVHFEYEDEDTKYETQFIRIDDDGDDIANWAMRIFADGKYFDEFFSPLNGLRFLK